MILIGQFDSPFVRRVGIALRLYEMPFEHRPWSSFGDADKIAAYNPLRRVPTLVLPGGDVLIESAAILDFLDEEAGPARAMIADHGPDRRRALKTCALATGLADKAVGLIYEAALHKERSEFWIARCRTQIGAVLDALEAERGAQGSLWWYGEQIGHADVAVGCALRFVCDAHGALFSLDRWPQLAAHSARCEAMPAFVEISQVFIPPA